MSSRIDEIRKRHTAAGDPGDPHCAECSDASYPIWPCDAADLLGVIDAQQAIMDSQARVSEQHRRRVQEVAVEMARVEAKRGQFENLAERMGQLNGELLAERDALLAEVERLTGERDALVEDNTALRWQNGDSYDTFPPSRLREPEYFKVGDRELEKTAVCRCCDHSWAWSYVSPDGYCLHCVDGRAGLLAELARVEAERDEQNTAVRELHEAALGAERARTQHWMGLRDKACDQLADERKAHARTQKWLDKFQSEAATQQVRAIMAEQALAKVEAEVERLTGELADAHADLAIDTQEIRRCEAERDALASRLAAAEAANERTITGILQDLLDMPQDDPDHDDAITVLYDHLLIVLECWVRYGGVEPALGESRAALAGSREQAAATTTTRTITMRCHCGRGVTIGPDPWCEGCVQSAATCDCVPVVIGEGA